MPLSGLECVHGYEEDKSCALRCAALLPTCNCEGKRTTLDRCRMLLCVQLCAARLLHGSFTYGSSRHPLMQVPVLKGKTREEVKAALKSERAKVCHRSACYQADVFASGSGLATESTYTTC
jgi:hypothetical protein